ncbi:rhodanese-like domain-containing protein [Rhodopila sp.]|jgi:rhodanese-related sulfurtransferase|uniref:rhodanese-like domain-containing protein n=1 Tax=Rhodopila sp. TaxID=2480087 RepID=UPI002B6C62EC|nr:rhodanese-like domain-containing protein [Rhodopila sp.]HVZ06321.1 rhodanese-like domain-containing protein [Rhodopila sp.]
MIPNIPPTQTWDALRNNPNAQMVDVRTEAEWAFVGVADLSEAGKQAVLIQWQVYPSMQRDRAFEDRLARAGFTPDHHLYFICRSGVRSLAAAEAARAAGFPHVFNVADGFEGPIDAHGHRGHAAGWKAEGLPWLQR